MSMRLEVDVVASWPRLGWVAEAYPGSETLRVCVGQSVEHGPDFAVEAVWDGPYAEAGFDRTDLVFGSGVRVREGRAIFVSSGTTVDRLWWLDPGPRFVVANSLPLLLAWSGVRLSETYDRYTQDIESVCSGLDRYVGELPTDGPPIRVVYFDNLEWDGQRIQKLPKPLGASWENFDDYRRYLTSVARRLGENARAYERKASVTIAGTVSTGYDSPAAAVVAAEAEARTAYTLDRARSVLPRSDDGSKIAAILGLECEAYRRKREHLRQERRFICALGWSMDINMSVFDYPEGLTLLFTGFHGDKFWDPQHGLASPTIVRGDPSGLGMAEFRLSEGILHCPVPFWGVRRAREMIQISRSPEMTPWSVGGDYDRPVPRRIVEEAGVPRSSFGSRKKATTLDWHHHWPETDACRREFRDWLAARGMRARSPVALAVGRWVEGVINSRLRALFRTSWPRWRCPDTAMYLFAWANNSAADGTEIPD